MGESVFTKYAGIDGEFLIKEAGLPRALRNYLKDNPTEYMSSPKFVRGVKDTFGDRAIPEAWQPMGEHRIGKDLAKGLRVDKPYAQEQVDFQKYLGSKNKTVEPSEESIVSRLQRFKQKS